MLEFFIWSLSRYFVVNFIDFGEELVSITRLFGADKSGGITAWATNTKTPLNNHNKQ